MTLKIEELTEVQKEILTKIGNETLNLATIQKKIGASHHYTVSNNVKKLEQHGYLDVKKEKKGGFGKEYKIKLSENGKELVKSINGGG